jgi:hypothetical protein
MRLRMKVYEGANRGLCRTCSNAHIMTDTRGDQTVYCNGLPGGVLQIHRVIAECNGYRKMGEMSEWEAKQQGWILEVKGTRVIGFKPPGQGGED